MNHGPIDLIVEAWGDVPEVHAAYRQAAGRFQSILNELVRELPELRLPATGEARTFASSTAQRMESATSALVARNRGLFLTPMAAVAGAVADEILEAMTADRLLAKAYVNNGGDIASHLGPDAELKAAIAGTMNGIADTATLRFDAPVRAIATSGWRGRSFSLGIADAVTVLAATAAKADAAATVIANAVDLPGHPSVVRRRACDLAPDTDLGDRLVTTQVRKLSPRETASALEAGAQCAERLRAAGLIEDAALFLGDQARSIGVLAGTVLTDKRFHHTPKLAASRQGSSAVPNEHTYDGRIQGVPA
ncbi:MAG: UPF0280 family protein [Rhizobiaceae bacterium]|nr:UPF0280 family protein [Rhizobiaceae bacterium]